METLEDIFIKKGLDGSGGFLCTDNMVSENIAAARSLRSESPCDLVVQLHFLCMRYRYHIMFIHVAGTRMIVQGTDGLSRGSLYERVMNDKPILSFLPIGESALHRYEQLVR